MTIPTSEWEDFEMMLRSRRRSLDSFSVSETGQQIVAPPGYLGPAVSTVVVKSLHNDAVRTYRRGGVDISTSPFVAWVRVAGQDIDNGVFG